MKSDRCLKCGTDKVKHVARGLCVRCYNDFIQERHSGKKLPGKRYAQELDKELLTRLYCDESRSLSDIAKQFGITRQAVSLKMKKWGIQVRSLEKARRIALDEGKLSFEKQDDFGNLTKIKLGKRHVNESFFDNWTPAMAYVLGLFATDGNISICKTKGANAKQIPIKRISFAQKEPELLEKILLLMNSNAKIIFQKERIYSYTKAGSLYHFVINSEKLFTRLLDLGITERKSLSVTMPSIPTPYVRDFIRGCWDGDGSIGKHGKNSYQARFFSGSELLIKGILAELEKAGFPARNIYSRNNGRYFWFSYVGKNVGNLYKYLYKDVPHTMRYERKYKIFKKAHESIDFGKTLPLF